MARVPTIDPEEFPSELAEILGHPRSDQRVVLGALPAWAVRPELAVAMVTFQRALDTHAQLPARLRSWSACEWPSTTVAAAAWPCARAWRSPTG